MFGIIYALFTGTLYAASSIKNVATDISNKRNKRLEGTNLYYDHDYVLRDINTNERMSLSRDENGDRVLYDHLRRPVRNYTQEERNKKYEELRRCHPEDVTVCLIESNNHWSDRIQGRRYKDLDNGRLYVTRYLTYELPKNKQRYKGEAIHGCYYMDVETEDIVRRVDGVNKDDPIIKQEDEYIIGKWREEKKNPISMWFFLNKGASK